MFLDYKPSADDHTAEEWWEHTTGSFKEYWNSIPDDESAGIDLMIPRVDEINKAKADCSWSSLWGCDPDKDYNATDEESIDYSLDDDYNGDIEDVIKELNKDC